MSNGNFGSGPILAGDGVRKYMTLVYNKMFLALCLTGAVSFVCALNADVLAFLAGGFSILLILATIGIVIYISARINKIDSEKAKGLFWLYSALIGASLSPIFAAYTGESIANAFFMAALFFGGMSLYGYVTKKDLTGVGSFMIVGLWTVVISSIVNIFLQSSGLQIGLSALSVMIFCGLTAYDVQKIKEFYNETLDEETLKKRAIIGSLSLYLDFINLFLSLLRLLGNRR
ncbi:MAG: Bax inhibitor-1/YccA family protein [Holosporales bacterium]|jgi:FtsH-binding integral membrane protein|nr:Bax inhibitor-1/YccA family protein [Holosporales bacterium]